MKRTLVFLIRLIFITKGNGKNRIIRYVLRKERNIEPYFVQKINADLRLTPKGFSIRLAREDRLGSYGRKDKLEKSEKVISVFLKILGVTGRLINPILEDA